MAEPKSSNNLQNNRSLLPSNEELIDSLVSGLEDCSVQDTPQLHMNLNSSFEEISDCDNKNNDVDLKKVKCEVLTDNEKASSQIDLDDDNGNSSSEENDNLEGLPSNEDDLVDELALKDLELTYTEEDKKRLHAKADDLKLQGNGLFKSGEFRQSALSYTKALRICPLTYSKERAIFYANRAAAKLKLELNESAIEDCSKALELDENYLKALFRRAQLYETTEKLDEALADYKKILELDPLHQEALYASKRLPHEIQERNEKLKAEMMGKLKDLGNMFLRPFGLSTDNFQMNQDPNSGGYSINFKS